MQKPRAQFVSFLYRTYSVDTFAPTQVHATEYTALSVEKTEEEEEKNHPRQYKQIINLLK